MVTRSCGAISAAWTQAGSALTMLAPARRRRNSRRSGERIFTANAPIFDEDRRWGNPFVQMNLEGLDHIALAVSDVEESVKWYRRCSRPRAATRRKLGWHSDLRRERRDRDCLLSRDQKENVVRRSQPGACPPFRLARGSKEF